MKVLVVGSGGREHALCWKLAQSPRLKRLYCAPGNAGIAQIAECMDVAADDISGLLQAARAESVDLTVVGPEVPLVTGIVDAFREEGLSIFGPTASAARLEGSKAYARRFMRKHRIPAPDFAVFEQYDRAVAALKKGNFPVVIKASGLAAGKGTIICSDFTSARDVLKAMLIGGQFGKAGSKVVIEEYLQGNEASVQAITDGVSYVCLPPVRDYKRLLDGDRGPNTGGMGAYAPTPLITPQLQSRIEEKILRPTLQGLRENGTPFVGCLYLGLMICRDGPKLLEYNCRFGDPEAQVALPLLKGDLLEIILATLGGKLREQQAEIRPKAAVCVVLASRGYPGKYVQGKPIAGLDKTPEGVLVFHAGTELKDEQITTAGGRILGVTGLGGSLREAAVLAYRGAQAISFAGKTYRMDIAERI